MDVLVLVIEIVLCLFALFMIAVVLLQSGKSAGLSGDIGGAAEQFMGKSKAKSYDGTLKKLTKVAAIGIMVLAIGLVVVAFVGATKGVWIYSNWQTAAATLSATQATATRLKFSFTVRTCHTGST